MSTKPKPKISEKAMAERHAVVKAAKVADAKSQGHKVTKATKPRKI